MPITIKNTHDVELNDGIKILVYGEAKIGKTRLNLTLPNPFIFACETGYMSGLLSLRGEQVKLPFFEVKTESDLDEAFKWASSSKEAEQYESFSLDSISEFASIKFEAVHRKYSGDHRKSSPETTNYIEKLIRDWLGLKKNVYFTAKEYSEKDEFNKSCAYLAFPTPKLQGVRYMFDEIFRYRLYTDPQTKEVIPYLQTNIVDNSYAGDRSGKLEAMEEPDLSNIINKIINE